MPQAVLLAAVGIVAVVAYRLIRREMQRVGVTLAEIRTPPAILPGTRLVRGADGVYRPEQHRR